MALESLEALQHVKLPHVFAIHVRLPGANNSPPNAIGPTLKATPYVPRRLPLFPPSLWKLPGMHNMKRHYTTAGGPDTPTET